MTWYDVPYDFGLSAGKTFLTAQTTTEFVLILDDDFVRTPHTSAGSLGETGALSAHPKQAPLQCSTALCVSATASAARTTLQQSKYSSTARNAVDHPSKI